MGNIIDLTGQQFGYLTVLKRVENNKHNSAQWLCKCVCGNEKVVSSQCLRQGKVKSCGCKTQLLKEEKRNLNLTGMRFGSLTVLKRVPKPEHLSSTGAYYLCICDCGTEKIIMGKSLRSGHTTSCGCHRQQQEDLTGKRYGKLTVLGIDYKHLKGNGTYYICQCDCGNQISVQRSNLIYGNVQSCGCLASVGEANIKEILNNNQIKYFSQYSFSDLNSPLGYPLRFDFAIYDKNNNIYLCEFQGEQHYELTSKFFDSTVVKHDQLKRKYCFENNIQLIEIPYWKRNSVSLEDLLLETSQYITTQTERNAN